MIHTGRQHGVIKPEMPKGRGNPGGKDGHYPPANLSISDEALRAFDETKNNHEISNYLINGQPIYLYNLSEDPYEYNNTAQEFPEIVDEMMMRLEEYEATMIPPDIADLVEEGNPSHFVVRMNKTGINLGVYHVIEQS